MLEDNFRAMLRGNFKGHAKPLDTKKEPAYGDP